MKMLLLIPLVFSQMVGLCATDSAKENTPCQETETHPFEHVDQVIIQDQKILVRGETISYETRAGSISVQGKNETDIADLAFIAYFATGSASKDRPISFCFNGGPGSSSVWLHMGLLGPKIVDIRNLSEQQLHPGYIDNTSSLLAVSDLVFIDPVGTGFSKASKQTKETSFFGVEEDLYPIANFIRLFLTKFQRWENPKFLIGESYGTLRATGLTSLLQEKYLVNMDGIVLISCVLNFQSLEDSILSAITNLPSFAATAQYHKRLSAPLSSLPISEIVEKASSFAINEYAPALLLGDSITQDQKKQIATRLSEFTSLSPEFLSNHNLRVSFEDFRYELLRSQGLNIGLYDSRMTAPVLPNDLQAIKGISPSLDHSFYWISSAFASALESYLSTELKWNQNGTYVFMNGCGRYWNFSVDGSPPAGIGYLSLLHDLRIAMLHNSKLSVFVAGGYYDFATTYFSQKYSLDQLLLPESARTRVTLKGYAGGHMMYLENDQRQVLAEDISTFLNNALLRNRQPCYEKEKT